MWDPAIDDVRLAHPLFYRMNAGQHLRDHASVEDAGGDQAIHLPKAHRRHQRALVGWIFHDAGHVGEKDELLRVNRGGDLAGSGVGVDVVRRAILATADGCDDWDRLAGDQLGQWRGIDGLHIPYEAQLNRAVRSLGYMRSDRQDTGIPSRDADGVATQCVYCLYEAGVDLAEEHILDDLHRIVVRYPQSIDPFRLDFPFLQSSIDGGATTVDDDWIDADKLHEYEILQNRICSSDGGQRAAAILDDDRLFAKGLDVGQGLHEDGGLVDILLQIVLHRFNCLPPPSQSGSSAARRPLSIQPRYGRRRRSYSLRPKCPSPPATPSGPQPHTRPGRALTES